MKNKKTFYLLILIAIAFQIFHWVNPQNQIPKQAAANADQVESMLQIEKEKIPS